jgi:hypothetical protein
MALIIASGIVATMLRSSAPRHKPPRRTLTTTFALVMGQTTTETTCTPHSFQPAQLQECMTSGQPLVVFDCSFDLMNPNIGPAAFEQCHIMGARYANLNTDLSAHATADGSSGDDAPASAAATRCPHAPRLPAGWPARAWPHTPRWWCTTATVPTTAAAVVDAEVVRPRSRGHAGRRLASLASHGGRNDKRTGKHRSGSGICTGLAFGQAGGHGYGSWPTWAQPARPCWTHGVPRATVARWSPWTPLPATFQVR